MQSNGLERRHEILYGTPGTAVYSEGRLILWIPEDFGSLTKKLPRKELEALRKELKEYFEPQAADGEGE
jgi:hypothetical protein